jgi:hypothetical protein
MERKELSVTVPDPRGACRRFLCCLAPLFLAFLVRPVAAQVGGLLAGDPVHNPTNGHWYQVVFALAPVSWQHARDAAGAMSFLGYRGHLATITSPEENQFVWNRVVGVGGGRYDFWLGGYQDTSATDFREPRGGWRWVTGERFADALWADGQPNNAANGSETVIEYRRGEGELWNDGSAGPRSGPYLVEYEAPVTPIPTTLHLGILPNPVIGGQSTVGLVLLDRPAAPKHVDVAFESSNPTVVTVPARVTVPEGADSVPFSIVTSSVAARTRVTLTASGPGGRRTITVEVLPPDAPLTTGNLLNGGFEQPRIAGNATGLVLQKGDFLPGWRITRGSVEVNRNRFSNSSRQSLDLAGAESGAIEQSFATFPGHEYLLSGWLTFDVRNPLAPEGRADLILDGQTVTELYHRNAIGMSWKRFDYRFRATRPTTTLAFADTTSAGAFGGLVLDDLTVTWLPPNLLLNGSFEEPETALSTAVPFVKGWRALEGYVHLVAQFPQVPGQGRQFLDLSVGPLGTTIADPATIEQRVATEPGRLYSLSGWVSHRPRVPGGYVDVSINGEFLARLYHTNVLYGETTETEMRWQPFRYWFRATTGVTTLTLTNTTSLPRIYGVYLDGLVLTEEPSGPDQP